MKMINELLNEIRDIVSNRKRIREQSKNIDVLERWDKIEGYCSRKYSKARLRRLRIQLDELLKEEERK